MKESTQTQESMYFSLQIHLINVQLQLQPYSKWAVAKHGTTYSKHLIFFVHFFGDCVMKVLDTMYKMYCNILTVQKC